jgi:hypothetical protein
VWRSFVGDDSSEASHTGDVYSGVKNHFGPWSVDVVKECNAGSHKGLVADDTLRFVRNVDTIAKGILALS